MTAYDTGRYEMFKRVCRFGQEHSQLFSEASDARKTFALVATWVEEVDALSRRKRDAMEHGWRRKADARKALTARLRMLARIACDASRRVPGADAKFPLPSHPSDALLVQTGYLFSHECEKAREMFRRYGVPDTFVDDLRKLVDQFEDSRNGGWNRRIAIVVARDGIARALDKGLDAVRTLDVMVANRLANQPTLMAVWRDIRRNDSRRKSQAPPASHRGIRSSASFDATGALDKRMEPVTAH